MNFSELSENRLSHHANGTPFDRCDFCSKPLEPGDFFVIAKAFEHGKLVMEAAQCLACQKDSSGYVSEQSAENLQLYAGRRFQAFLERNLESDPLEDLPFVPECLFTGEALTTSDQFECYTLHAPWDTSNPCFLVGPTAIEQMSELLSEETRKFWDSYIEQIEPVSPDWVISPMFLG